MEVRLKKDGKLIGHTEEFKAGTARTLESGPLQAGIDLEMYDLKVVMHPTRIRGQIYLGYAILAESEEHAQRLPGYKPFGAGTPDKVVVETSRKRRNKPNPFDGEVK